MTKANVLQLGFFLILLGGIGYGLFIALGFDEVKAGIISQSLLVLILVGGWIISYFRRVFSGKMTFMEQRKRYMKEYDLIADKELQNKFNSMSDEERIKLIKEVEKEKS